MPSTRLTFEALKNKQRERRDGFSDSFGLRIHRSISWVGRAEQEAEDRDAAFIFYWIGFNAAYANDIPAGSATGERESFDEFFAKLISYDRENRIYKEIWGRFSDSIRVMLDNRYVFQPFWNHHNGMEGYADWEDRFNRSRTRIHRALLGRETKVILTTVFDRLYVLRNQLVHGGATWNSETNRAQVTDGAKILSFLLPIFIDLLMDNPEADWGKPFYPVVPE